MDDLDPYQEAAKALYGKWARIVDPAHLDRRWSRLLPKVREDFISEARTVIDTYNQLMGR